MSRPAVLTAAAVALALVYTVPVDAAPRRQVDTGTYDVTVLPDPTGVTADAPVDDPYARCGAVGGHVLFWELSEHGFLYRPPAAGTLTVTLRMKDPTGAGQHPDGLDWDLRIYDVSSNWHRLLSSSTGLGGYERTVTKLAARQRVAIVACNDSGFPEATVSYVFRY